MKVNDIISYGPGQLEYIGKRIKNIFWRECLISVKAVMSGTLLNAPEKLLLAPFWRNPAITRNNKQIKPSDFPVLNGKIKTVSDFFLPGTNQLETMNSFNQRYGIEIDNDSFIELRYILKCAIQQHGLQIGNLPAIELPQQPLLVHIATRFNKGCSYFYRCLQAIYKVKRLTAERETKWHLELGQTLGVPFWNKIYNQISNIKYDNALKWVQYQIARNSLYTNYRVNKFNPQVSPMCSFCKIEYEKVSHLYFTCNKVQLFLKEVPTWLNSLNIILPLTKNLIIFGIPDQPANSRDNLLILWIKGFIWNSRIKEQPPLLSTFKITLKNRLQDLKDIYEFKEEGNLFSTWINMYDSLLQNG